MPLTKKGQEILANMRQEYGPKRGESIFYASKNAGKISGVDSIRERALAAGIIGEDADLSNDSFLQNVILTLALIGARRGVGATAEDAEWNEEKHPRDHGQFAASPHEEHVNKILKNEDVSQFLKGAPPGFKIKLAGSLAMMAGSAIKHAMANDSIALDKGTVRSYDESGHLRVERTPISRANVCDYQGSEIPDEDGSLRLDPNKTYRLYRDAQSLKDAAHSFAGKPILLRHEPISADEHPRDLVVGAVGEPVQFDGDTLSAPITVWDKEAIDKINNGELKGLSAGYFYKPKMKPGAAPNGERFDGSMHDISFNHLALVKTPRVEGAYVADSANGGSVKEGSNMRKPKSAASRPALARALGKIAAMDESALTKLLAALEDKPGKDGFANGAPDPNGKYPISNKGWDPSLHIGPGNDADGDYAPMETRPGGVNAASAPGGMFSEGGEGNTGPGAGGNSGGETYNEGEDDAEGVDPFAQIREFLTGKLSDEDIAQLDELIAAIAKKGVEHEETEEAEEPKVEGEAPPAEEVTAEAPEVEEAPEETGEDSECEEKKENKDMVTKPAMDAAIAAAVAAERRRQKEIREAEEAVRPVVGKLIAQDSAEAVYRAAFKKINKDVSKVHASALPVLFAELAAVKNSKPSNSNVVAMDAGADKEYAERFPNARRLKI